MVKREKGRERDRERGEQKRKSERELMTGGRLERALVVKGSCYILNNTTALSARQETVGIKDGGNETQKPNNAHVIRSIRSRMSVVQRMILQELGFDLV